MDALSEMRASLAARALTCWERLDDVVSELIEVHGIPADDITSWIELSFDATAEGSGTPSA